MNKTERQARRAADQAEYQASLERAAEAADEQRARGSSTAATAGLAFGLLGLAVGHAWDQRKKATPPRPDLH